MIEEQSLAEDVRTPYVKTTIAIPVDGMIVVASTTLLAGFWSGCKGGGLPQALLVAGCLASLAADGS